jgi:hypothetical protein
MFKVYKNCCRNCLFSSDSIVSPERRKEIVESCVKEQSYFICHKSTMEGINVCCRKYYDKFGHFSQLIRIAERLNLVRFIEHKNQQKLVTYKEMTNEQKD